MKSSKTSLDSTCFSCKYHIMMYFKFLSVTYNISIYRCVILISIWIVHICYIVFSSINNKTSPMVEKPFLIHIKEMVMCSRKRSDLGETKCKKLAEMFSTFSEDDLQNVRYHSACRKLVIFTSNTLRELKIVLKLWLV